MLGRVTCEIHFLPLNTKRDRTMQWQMLWVESHWSWMQELWSPSWMESPWEWQKEWMLMIWLWLRLMKKYISKSGKLWFWLEPSKHMWTYMWLIGWPPNRRSQYLRPQLGRFLTGKCRIWNTCWEMMQIQRTEKLSFESGRSWHYTREPSTIATHQLGSSKKFCSL